MHLLAIHGPEGVKKGAAPAVTFTYNELGLRTNMTDASGTTAFRYDNRNRLVEKAMCYELFWRRKNCQIGVVGIECGIPDWRRNLQPDCRALVVTPVFVITLGGFSTLPS